MSLKHQIEIVPLTCIHPAQGIDICPVDTAGRLDAAGGINEVGVTEFRIPFSHETNLVYVAPNTIEDLFMHHFQTDQLLVVRGQAVLVVLQNRSYQYIILSECDPKVVRIPPGIPHGAINFSATPCVAINSVIRHGAPHERDYRPLKQPIPYDLARVRSLLAEFRCPSMAQPD